MKVVSFLVAALATSLASDDDLDIVTEAPIPVTDVEMVVGQTAKLPCDLSPPTDHDRVSLIIWYKDNAKTPIYSLDVRESGLGQGKEVKKTEGQLSYITNFPHSSLVLESVTDRDRGLYKCRVDFKHSPTRNAHVNLSVIVPASSVTVTDATGVALQQSTAGPVAEGSSLDVACVALGDTNRSITPGTIQYGWPSPRLTWWQDNDMIDDSMDQPEDGRVRNTLTIQTVSRELVDSKLECRASNSPLLDPIVVILSLDILLLPLEVRLLGENLPLSAGSMYEVVCRSVGSKPAASITWWRSNKLLQAPTRIETSEDGNTSTSTVTLAALREDNGRSLTCRAANPHIPSSGLEDSWILDIHYRPVATADVGSSLNTTNIREGMDVYLECRVDSNPRPSRIHWTQNRKHLSHNASAGVLTTNQTLVLQTVRRESAGMYSCLAANSEGEAESEPYLLNIKYEPRCRDSQQRVYGAARLEDLLVTCQVDANPPATTFHWTFNNSIIQERRLESAPSVSEDESSSQAHYTAFSETDFGTLLCWARNDVGPQLVPCVFHIVPAGVPDAPHNCSVSNRSQSWIHISCSPGFDGGLPQQFTAEIWRGTTAVVSNVTSRSSPQFTLTSLEPGVSYTVVVYSSNGKGRSSYQRSLQATTLGHTQTHRRITESTLPTMDPLMLVTSGIVIGVLLMVGVVLMVVVCVKRRSLQGSPDISSVQLDKTHSLLSVTVPSTTLEDDRNPDVIPHKNEMEATILTSSSEPGIEQWLPPINVNLPKEAILSEAWGVSVWPGTCAVQKSSPVQRNAGTQTLQHKESTV